MYTKEYKELALAINMTESKLLKWINHADLFYACGISSEYFYLLEAAAVDKVPELRQRNATAIHAKLLRTNEEKELPANRQSGGRMGGSRAGTCRRDDYFNRTAPRPKRRS